MPFSFRLLKLNSWGKLARLIGSGVADDRLLAPVAPFASSEVGLDLGGCWPPRNTLFLLMLIPFILAHDWRVFAIFLRSLLVKSLLW